MKGKKSIKTSLMQVSMINFDIWIRNVLSSDLISLMSNLLYTKF